MTWGKRRKRVRVHFLSMEPSIEGFLIGRVNGHYRIALAELLQQDGQTLVLEGREVAIPREQVAFYQELR